jgi:hypothetical protein
MINCPVTMISRVPVAPSHITSNLIILTKKWLRPEINLPGSIHQMHMFFSNLDEE